MGQVLVGRCEILALRRSCGATTSDSADRFSHPCPMEVSGVLLPAKREVWLNATEPAPRRRFTLAHELGHRLCQVQEGRGAPVMSHADDVGVGEGRALEWEADFFAAELMPEELMLKVWKGDVKAAAERLGVTGRPLGGGPTIPVSSRLGLRERQDHGVIRP